MGLFKFIKKALDVGAHRRKDFVTAEEFIDYLESDFGRKIDEESRLFFRHHIASVNLLNKILTGRLGKQEKEKGSLVLKTLLAEALDYTLNIESLFIPGSNELKPDNNMASILGAFTKTYPDAGNIMTQAICVFLGKQVR